MKNVKMFIGMLILAAGSAGCSSAYYRSGSYASDDLYGTHDRVAIAQRQKAQAEAERAAAEARKAEWEARIAEAQAAAAENSYYAAMGEAESVNPYQSVLADTYESAYARRLSGFQSPTYNLPSSYYNLRYSNAFHYVTAYDPAFYNIMVMGDQVWVEPKYITSMFGSWGRPSIYSDAWYFGWGFTPSYAWLGFYPRYSWWDWNWNICYNPWYYDPWYWGWGWGPHWHHPGWGGWGPARPSRPHNIVSRPSPYRSPSSGRQFGSVGNSSTTFRRTATPAFGVRGSVTNGSSSQQFNRGSSTRNQNGSTTVRRGSTTFNRSNDNSSSTTNRSSYNSNSSSSFNRGSSSGSSSGSSRGGSSGSSVGGRNAGGR